MGYPLDLSLGDLVNRSCCFRWWHRRISGCSLRAWHGFQRSPRLPSGHLQQPSPSLLRESIPWGIKASFCFGIPPSNFLVSLSKLYTNHTLISTLNGIHTCRRNPSCKWFLLCLQLDWFWHGPMHSFLFRFVILYVGDSRVERPSLSTSEGNRSFS